MVYQLHARILDPAAHLFTRSGSARIRNLAQRSHLRGHAMKSPVSVGSNIILYGFLLWLLYDSTIHEWDPWFAFVVGFVLLLAVVISLVPSLRAKGSRRVIIRKMNERPAEKIPPCPPLVKGGGGDCSRWAEEGYRRALGKTGERRCLRTSLSQRKRAARAGALPGPCPGTDGGE